MCANEIFYKQYANFSLGITCESYLILISYFLYVLSEKKLIRFE